MTTIKIQPQRKSDDGTLDVTEEARIPAWDASASFSVVGQPRPRVEAAEKVTGRAQYAYDIRLPGQLYARVLRSPFPHARIRSIDTSRAEALPGVLAVVSYANTPEIEWYEDSFVFDRILRFVGDEVAAVAATSEEVAADALALIDVDYEPLPFVTHIEAALHPEAPRLRDPGNIAGEPKVYRRGDIDAGFGDADVVIDSVYTTQTAVHNCMEPHGCTAWWRGDELNIWDSTQSVFAVRHEVAQKLGLPEHRVRVIKQFMGGGFGSKQIAWKHEVIAALLSRRASKPVQLMLDREAENLAVGNRNPTRQHIRIGAKRDGTLTAIQADVALGAGAHIPGGEGSDVAATYHRLYRCPNVRTQQIEVYTNTGPAVAFRAPGFVEGAFAFETAMDELARTLEMDPVDLRLRNYAEVDQEEDKPYTQPEGLRRCYERATDTFGWHDRQRPADGGPRRRGFGFAAHDWAGGGWPPGYAVIKINESGGADVVTGTQDIGTGTRTGLAQVAAEELGLPLESVTVHLGDTAVGPYAPVSAGSATQATIGPAIRVAAADAKTQLLELAAALLESDAADLSIEQGQITVRGAPDRSISVAEVTRAIEPHMIQGHGARGPNPSSKSVRTFGAQCVEVEVDVETGEVTVLRVVAAHDCGRVINPTMVESQVVGGVTQGIGFGLIEERVVDQTLGYVMNANLENYKVPTVADVPTIEYVSVDLPDPEANPTGAKGIGEPPLIPTAPAIANAIFDAIGIRFRHSPITRRDVLEALTEQRGGAP